MCSWACSQPAPYQQKAKMCFFPPFFSLYPAGGGFGGCSMTWCCGGMDETQRAACPRDWPHPEQQNSSPRVALQSTTHAWPHAASPGAGTSVSPCCHKPSCSLQRGQTLSHHLHASCTASDDGISPQCPSWGPHVTSCKARGTLRVGVDTSSRARRKSQAGPWLDHGAEQSGLGRGRVLSPHLHPSHGFPAEGVDITGPRVILGAVKAVSEFPGL